MKYLAQKAAVTVVPKIPPRNPSQVLFGESLISFVLPKVIPNKYAKASLKIMRRYGIMNQICPL